MVASLRRRLGELAVPLLVVEAARDRITDNAANAALLDQRLGDCRGRPLAAGQPSTPSTSCWPSRAATKSSTRSPAWVGPGRRPGPTARVAGGRRGGAPRWSGTAVP